MAVELRNWARKDCQADVVLFDQLSGQIIWKVGLMIAERRKERTVLQIRRIGVQPWESGFIIKGSMYKAEV